MDILSHIPYELLPWQWVVLAFSGICIGASKTGITNISNLAIPFFVMIFGAKPSTGIILPLLCLGDLFAVIYYRRHAEWKYILKLLPWALAGFALALAVERVVPAQSFKILIGSCILAGLVVMFINDRRGKDAVVPSGWWVSAIFGVIGGFSTMIGNAAGPIMSVFLLSVRLPKTSFVGTAAWFFLIINYLKLPLQYFAWKNISAETLLLDLVLVPFIFIGTFLGVILIKKISESLFRRFVYALLLISTILLFI
jgi:uncharacterized membrane protein YfcA